MATKGLAAVVKEPGKIELEEFTLPKIGPEDGLLRVEMVGVCGTDPGLYRGKVKLGPYPFILGHEILGRVEEVGSEMARRFGIKKGERVIVEAFIRCGHCDNCKKGNYRFCVNQSGYGGFISAETPPYLWGAYGEYMYLAPGSAGIYPVSEETPAEAAVLINAVISNGIRWVREMGGVTIGDTVVIQGVGQQGLAATIAAREAGAALVIVTGLSIDSERFKLAKEFGADVIINAEQEDVVFKITEITQGKLADVVVDVTGNPEALQIDPDIVKPQGTIVSAGITGTETITPLLMDKIVFKEIRLQGVLSNDITTMRPAIRLVESRKYPIEKIVTHKFPLLQAERAVQTTGKEFPADYPIKVVIKP
jgi:alcohol dehydrogenase